MQKSRAASLENRGIQKFPTARASGEVEDMLFLLLCRISEGNAASGALSVLIRIRRKQTVASYFKT